MSDCITYRKQEEVITYWTEEEAKNFIGKVVRTNVGVPVTIVTKMCVSQKANQWMVVDSNGFYYKKINTRGLYCWA